MLICGPGRMRVSAVAVALVVFVEMLVVMMGGGEQPLSRIAIEKTVFEINEQAHVKAFPTLLGLKGQNKEWVTLQYSHPNPSNDDWIGVFSPAIFNSSRCVPPNGERGPHLCTAPIKFQFANFSNDDYTETGRGSLDLQLINQREDFSFALFSGGILNPILVAVSNIILFANPKAPVYPRLAQGKSWNEMTVTWTSGYDITEAEPLVEWGREGDLSQHSPAGTLTLSRESLCGPPAQTIGWRHPGYIHTSFLKELWPNSLYSYKVGHRLLNGSYVWSRTYRFKASPYPGQESVQRIVLFGDMGKAEADGSNEYADFQRASLLTTSQLIKDLNNIDMIIHIGDISYANGYISQWDQFTEQIEPLASTVPYMIGSGNHERDWPDSGSFYGTKDSGGECGVLLQTMFYAPSDNRAKLWYSTDYGMFRFCIADTELDWRPGTEQYKFIEQCFASVDRQKQPWLIFLAHRVLGYSSGYFYADEGTFAEPMGRESLQELWQKYKVDIALYGHVHNYERTCPIYQNICTNEEKSHYRGPLNGTIHVVAGGGGAGLVKFTPLQTKWSIFKDFDYGFVKLTAYNHSFLLFEYKKSSDGKVYDSFTIMRGYRDILACTFDSCPRTTLAS